MRANNPPLLRAALAAAALLLIAGSAAILFGYFPKLTFFDLQLRLNELQCLRQGIDPFDVWSERIELPGYTRLLHMVHKTAILADGTRVVHGYTPWQYTLLLPFTRLPEAWIRNGFFVGGILLAAQLLLTVCRRARAGGVQGLDLFFTAALVFSWSLAIALCLCVLNYGILIAALAGGLIRSLERRRDVLAGACWALMMIKPQIAILFFWPLFFGRRWITIGTAIALCLAASFPPGWLCGKSGFALILEAKDLVTPYASSFRTAPFVKLFGETIGIHALKGLFFLLCGGICWRLRDVKQWYVRFIPCAILSGLWMYSQMHDWIICWVAILFLSIQAFGTEDSGWGLKRISRLLLGGAIGSTLAFSVWFWCFRVLEWHHPRENTLFWVLRLWQTAIGFTLLGVLCLRSSRMKESA